MTEYIENRNDLKKITNNKSNCPYIAVSVLSKVLAIMAVVPRSTHAHVSYKLSYTIFRKFAFSKPLKIQVS